jgi:hypothetical protein
MKHNLPQVLLISIFLISISNPVFSQKRTIDTVGSRSFVAGPTSMEMDLKPAAGECLNWSWAACLQSVFKFYGLEISQEAINKKIFKDVKCSNPNSYAALNGVSGWAPDTGKKFSTVYSQGGVWTNDKIVATLAARTPMITTLQISPTAKQVYVLISIYYTEDSGMKVPDKVVLMEPASDAPPFIVMEWSKFQSMKPELFKFWITPKATPPKK